MKGVCRICGVPIVLNYGNEFAHKLCLELYPPGRAMAELNRRLLVLATWCQSRAAGEHNAETTITLLERKLDDLRMAYYIKLCETPSGKERGFK